MGWRRRFERIIVAATAVALQLALCLLLTESKLFPSRAQNTVALSVLILTAARPSRVRAVQGHASTLGAPMLRVKPPAVQPISLPELQEAASGPAVDWQAAIARKMGVEVSPAPQPKRNFGFPQTPLTRGPPPFEGWDEVRIHRAQRLANGVIDLGRCVIRLSLSTFICHFGNSPANGQLFKHVHSDRTAVGSLP